MTRPILTVACKARDLSATLGESIRVDIHRQLDDLIVGVMRDDVEALELRDCQQCGSTRALQVARLEE